MMGGNPNTGVPQPLSCVPPNVGGDPNVGGFGNMGPGFPGHHHHHHHHHY